MKSIDDTIIDAVTQYEGRYLVRPGKLLLGVLEWSKLDAYLMEHHGFRLPASQTPMDKRPQFRGLDVYPVDDNSYIFCAA